jgi:hypothetical protein
VDQSSSITAIKIKQWYCISKRAKSQIKTIIGTLQQVRQEEWINSKNYLVRIRKYGSIARMTNPKVHSGTTAGNFYPTKPNEPARPAINDRERKEASLFTHKIWINDPQCIKNCHFLDTIEDNIGTRGATVNPEKIFDAEAEWKYLEGLLEEKTNEEIAKRVRHIKNFLYYSIRSKLKQQLSNLLNMIFS